MKNTLAGKKVAILVANGFEQVEYSQPREALEKAGAVVHTISLKEGKVKGWKHDHWGDEFAVDKTIGQVKAGEYDGLLLPGGQMNPDTLRNDEQAVAFVRSFFSEGKPVAAICHAPWLLVEADVVEGRSLTSYSSIKTDMINAGALWKDQEVVVDGGLVTSRNPDDLPAFCKSMVEVIAKGIPASETSQNKTNAKA
jgi:protease I